MTSAVPQRFDRVVVFGDSFSDVGNVFQANGGTAPAPPYVGGRFTDGPLWVEQLGSGPLQRSGATLGDVDYAYGGARTSGGGNSLNAQFAAYLGAGGRFGPADLVVIFGGANNILQVLDPPQSADPTAAAVAAATNAAADVGVLVRAATAAGAGTVLVVDLHDLGASPNFLGGPMQAAASTATNAFNIALAGQVASANLASPDAAVLLLDIGAPLAAAVANPGAYGLANVTSTAWDGTRVLAADPDSYLWFDNIHWTETGHRLVAGLARSALYHDDVAGPGGSDLLWGFVRDDALSGEGGADTIIALGGDDTVSGGLGDDDLNGNVGRDLVHGDDGRDVVRGGKGDDQAFGDGGDDPHVNGNLGADTVRGGDGNDTVYGGQGNDVVYGDAGDDRLSGDLGADLLFGGSGADRFAFAPGFGVDWIGDFSAAEGDRVLLPIGTAYVVGHVSGQTVLTLAGGDQIGLAGVSGFSADWVVFG